ncbi:hypothetical protein ACFPFV_05285 [Salinicoccus siamensis]
MKDVHQKNSVVSCVLDNLKKKCVQESRRDRANGYRCLDCIF